MYLIFIIYINMWFNIFFTSQVYSRLQHALINKCYIYIIVFMIQYLCKGKYTYCFFK